jgi:erythromycin esterase-like protein
MSPVASPAALMSAASRPLRGMPADFDSIVELAGNARFVLIGEASHGTHEFYRVRAQITKRLIEELGFCAVAVEADWPDAVIQRRESDVVSILVPGPARPKSTGGVRTDA